MRLRAPQGQNLYLFLLIIIHSVPGTGPGTVHTQQTADWMCQFGPDSLPIITVGRTILTLSPGSASAHITTEMPFMLLLS